MMTELADDPRPLFARAVDQAERQVLAVRPGELGGGTPCADYDVRALLGHMVSVLRKLARVGSGLDARDVADAFAEFAPAGSRGAEGKFGPVVAVSGDADVYTRLAAFVGRKV
ncbi:maleylpyruvate isomerase N-terminal domain-containing protein [Phytomonospora sp. NPDC050363]|uniref:maleylpyruvate isomerase N-terminal domain-containing protein n=1 Tax=Phytomonospora sp. NPDC050363 TaxID=3155642 RepID=UPI0033DF71E4